MRIIWNSMFRGKKTIDDIKNDYSLFRNLYHGTNHGDNHLEPSIFLGSGFVKPIINSTLAYAMGLRFTVKLAGSDDNKALEAIEKELNGVIDKEFGKIYDWLKYGTRDGDGFIYIDEEGKPVHLKPETVDVVSDAITGRILGYNITENVEIVDANTGTKTKYVYLKQYRESYIRITRMLENQTQEQGTIIYERVFINGEDIDTQQLDENNEPIKIEAYEDEVDRRLLPIIHYKNEPEAGSLYGNSEIQNVLPYLQKYGGVLDRATDREIYNGTPVLAMYGISNPKDDKENEPEYETNDDGEKMLDWQQNTTLYLEDPKAKAEFLDIPATMENTSKLLELYFYNIVQASETPEFVFGVAVSSSKASVAEQTPVVVQKAARKREQMKTALIDFIKLYISRQLELSNPLYFPLQNADPELDLEFPSLVDEDNNLTKETIEMLLAEGAISRQTAIELSTIADRIQDAKATAEDGLKDLQLRNDANNVMPEETDRLDRELNSEDDDPLDNLDDEA